MVRTRSIRIVIGALREFTSFTAQRLTLNIVTRLTLDTPKDTGWASVNWIPQIGSPFRGTTGTKEAVSQGAQQSGLNSLLGYTLKQGPIHVSNSVPYILRLNEGSSRQAPALFVQAAVIGAVRQVGRIRGR